MSEPDRPPTGAANHAHEPGGSDAFPAGSPEDALEARARELGFTLFGIASPDPSEHTAFYRDWLEHGYHGEMGYLSRDDSIARREDLRKTMTDVRSVVVVGHEYYAEDDPNAVADPACGVIARYARGRDYHDVIKKKLLELLAALDEDVPGGVRGRAYVDTGPILERDLARRAGLGWFGRNTMLINPRRGSYFFLGLLLVDAELAGSEPFDEDRCGSCRACLDACPTGALLGRDESGAPVIDARRCISYLTIEHRGPIPEELRPLMGNRIYGCDICQEVCPWNERFAQVAEERAYVARAGREAEEPQAHLDPGDPPSPSVVPSTDWPALVRLMSMDEETWRTFTRESAIRRAGYGGFRRNVAIALGNWLAGSDRTDPVALEVLTAALSDEEDVVAEAAAWALRQVHTGDAAPGSLRRGS